MRTVKDDVERILLAMHLGGERDVVHIRTWLKVTSRVGVGFELFI